jgi:TRAP-type transport system periplasmic protein
MGSLDNSSVFGLAAVTRSASSPLRDGCEYSVFKESSLVMKFIGSFASAILAIGISALALAAKAQDVVLRIESNLPASQATGRAMEILKTEAARLSGGDVEVKVEAGSHRSLKELMDAIHVGGVFATWMSVGNFSKLVPEIAAVSLPFVFDNYDEARRVVDGPVGSLIATKLEAKGFVLLAWMDLGALHVSNSKRPLKTIDDFKGLILRVLINATHRATLQAIGARPVEMDLKEVGRAMAQGDVDGEEQDYSTTYANRYYESQRYLSDTGHFLDFHVLVANKRALASLNPTQQKAVREAAAIAAAAQRKMLVEDQATALQHLQERGVQFDPLSQETRAALRRATAGVVDDVKKWLVPRFHIPT